MKSLKCGDLTYSECDFMAQAETDEEVKSQIYQHAREKHSDMIDMMSPDDMEDMEERMDLMLENQS